MKMIDARGLSCPEPVVMLRRAMASGEASCQMLVDSNTARENAIRYAKQQGYRASVEEKDGEYTLTFTK